MSTGISGDQFSSNQAYKDAADTGLLQSVNEELQFLVHAGGLDDLYLDIVSPPFQAYGEESSKVSSLKSPKSHVEKSYAIPSASLEILRKYTGKFGKGDGKKVEELSYVGETQSNPLSALSANHIIKLAAVNFIRDNTGARDELSALGHPCASSFSGHAEDVQLVQDLMLCAEKVSNHHYVSASRLLAWCHNRSSSQTNVIKRLVYYFAEALSDKIDRETGKGMMKKSPLEPLTTSSALAVFTQKMPPLQIALFAGIQEVVHHVSNCKKVHIIDIEMRCGIQQVILMQALAVRPESQSPLKHLKITAVALKSSQMVEEAGVRLRDLAKSLNLNFSFNVIKIEDMLTLLSHHDRDVKTVVYASHAMKLMIPKPSQLEALMRVIKKLNPCVMIICEPEGNVNSPVFVNRFVEALFYYGTYFDCVDDCLKNAAAERTFVESSMFRPLLRTTVAAEGEERRSRIVGLSVWRAFFAKFGMVEKELSMLALNHANLVLNMFECRDSCTLGLNGNSLVIRWKETPVCSVSAWKFHKIRN